MKINGNTVGTPTPRTNYNQTNPKKADYLVGRENILGKDELTSATEEALRQAKESGEFDGADGVSCTHSWNGTTLTVTSASGTSSADLKGEKGDPGLGGTVNGEVPNEDGDILLYGPMGYEPKVTLAQSDMSRYLYLGSDARRRITSPEDVTVRATFKNGSVVDFTTSTGLTVVDIKSNYLSASIYTVRGDKNMYVVFDRKVTLPGLVTITFCPDGLFANPATQLNDYTLVFDTGDDWASVLKSGAQKAALWHDNVYGENGEKLPRNDTVFVWGENHKTHIFEYAGEVSSVANLPSSIPSKYDQAMMTVNNGDMYICMGDEYLVQTVLRNFGVSTKNTYIIVKEELATTVSSVTILLGTEIIATLTQNDVASAFFGKRDTPSFDWLTSRYEVRFTVDGEVMGDLVVNGFNKYQNFISAYSSIGCFISGVNGLMGYGESNEYCVIINPAVASINQVEIGSEPWKKIPHGAFPTDDVVRGGSVNLIESGAVKTYVDNMVEVKTKELKAYFDLIEERLLALAKAIGKEGE